jgi:hypothetical protein
VQRPVLLLHRVSSQACRASTPPLAAPGIRAAAAGNPPPDGAVRCAERHAWRRAHWRIGASIPATVTVEIAVKFIPHQRSRDAVKWLREELAEQQRRYRGIVAEQDALSSTRDKWVAQFLQRIQTRGYHSHLNNLERIPAARIPTRPRRKFRVVF